MSAAPIGSVVSLYYDARVDLVEGDALVTPSGRVYVLVSLRRQARGRHVGRWHVKAIVSAEIPPGARSFSLRWYKRGRLQRRSRAR